MVMKHRINELAMNSKNKSVRDLYRGINEFKRGYQPGSNLVKDDYLKYVEELRLSVIECA
jgi:hypothetical protein